MDEPRRHVAGLLSGLDVRYDLGDGHPLLGRRMPDLDLVTADGPLRVFTLLHPARPVLLDLGDAGQRRPGAWRDRVQLVTAAYDGAWELPVIGAVALRGRADPTRRARGLGGRRHLVRARGRAHHVVRTCAVTSSATRSAASSGIQCETPSRISSR